MPSFTHFISCFFIMDFRLFLVALSCCFTSVSSCKGQDYTSINPNSETNALECSNNSWMNSVTYRITNANGNYVDLFEANCIQQFCCEETLDGEFDHYDEFDYYGKFSMGDVLNGLRCNEPGHKINKTSARCVDASEDGDGWDLLSISTNKMCEPCPKGSYYDKNINACLLCPLNTYSNNTASSICTPCNSKTSYTSDPGATQCVCKRGLLRHPGSDECEFCPAGHTTYRSHPGVCVGPQLYGLRSNRDYVATFIVSLPNLGNLNNGISRWQSAGDWYIKKGKSTRRYIIRQRYTLSKRGYAKGYSIRRSRITVVEPLITNKYCYTGDGSDYTGYANRTVSEEPCTGPINFCRKANNGRACYCRHHQSHPQPVCETAKGIIEHCDIPKCVSGVVDVSSDCQYTRRMISQNLLTEETGSLMGLKRNEAEKACDRMGRECRGIWEYWTEEWRLSRVEAELYPNGDTEFWSKEKDCQPYYQRHFNQTFND